MEKLSAKFKKNKNVPMIVVSVQSVMQVGSKLQVVIMCNAKFANTASATSAAEKNVKLINVWKRKENENLKIQMISFED